MQIPLESLSLAETAEVLLTATHDDKKRGIRRGDQVLYRPSAERRCVLQRELGPEEFSDLLEKGTLAVVSITRSGDPRPCVGRRLRRRRIRDQQRPSYLRLVPRS